MHIISRCGCTVIYSVLPCQIGGIWFIDYLFLRKRVAENALILRPNYAVLIYPPPPAPPPPCPQVSIGVCWYSTFWLLLSSRNPHGSQYVILMGSEAFNNGIQTFWAVSKGDDFLLNGINPTNPVWNLINTSGRKCCFLCEMERTFHNKICLFLTRNAEIREGLFPGS